MASTSPNLGLTLPEMTDQWEDIIPGVSTSFTAIDTEFAATSSGGSHLHSGVAGQGAKIQASNLALANSTLSANGYLKIGTFVQQWGFSSSTAANPVTVSFPLAFPTACYSVIAVIETTAASDSRFISISGQATSTGFQARRWTETGSAATTPFYWMAVGK